jgi:hypothetical protein
MLTAENEQLIQEYLDIAVNASENLDRTTDLLSEDCTWFITPPGIAFTGKKQLRLFTGMAMGSRSQNADSKVEIRTCSTCQCLRIKEFVRRILCTKIIQAKIPAPWASSSLPC